MSATDSFSRTLLLLIAVILLVPFLLMIVAWLMMGMWGGGHMWDWNGTTGVGWAMLMMWALPLFVLAGIGYLLYRAFDHRDDRRTDAALEELRMAYARGDLSDEEFEERRTRLEREP